MSHKSKKPVSNIDINKGSILLIFDELDTKIARKWRPIVHGDHETGRPG
jgi:hypothetical protein